jgi:hypothetical protein
MDERHLLELLDGSTDTLLTEDQGPHRAARKKPRQLGWGLKVWRSALLLREGVTGTTDFPCFVYQT